MAEPRSSFDLSGGALCLDFVNTLGDRPRSEQERLGTLGDLLRFCVEAGTLSGAERRRLARAAARRPRPAAAFFRRALCARERLYRIFSARARGERSAGDDLRALNRELAAALRHLRLQSAGGGYGWAWDGAGGLASLLWPVSRSAAELLASAEAARVRECAADSCSWLFIDRCRTRRRWCDMKTCGNRAKARRHYQRKRRSVAG